MEFTLEEILEEYKLQLKKIEIPHDIREVLALRETLKKFIPKLVDDRPIIDQDIYFEDLEYCAGTMYSKKIIRILNREGDLSNKFVLDLYLRAEKDGEINYNLLPQGLGEKAYEIFEKYLIHINLIENPIKTK